MVAEILPIYELNMIHSEHRQRTYEGVHWPTKVSSECFGQSKPVALHTAALKCESDD